jgi:N-acetylglutamate synthase-like GNAT family acetyltransferase
MKEKDAEEVANIYATSFPEHVFIQSLTDPCFFRRELSKEDIMWVVAEEKESQKLVGAAALAQIPLNYSGEIERVVVERMARGQGISKMLVGSLVDAAERSGINYLFAWVRGAQPAMQKTFLDLGFEVGGVFPSPYVVMYQRGEGADRLEPRRSLSEPGEPKRELFVFMYKILTDDVVIPYSGILIDEIEKVEDRYFSLVKKAKLENIYNK